MVETFRLPVAFDPAYVPIFARLTPLRLPASYIIFQEDDLIKALNCQKGFVEFSSKDASSVIQSAINSLPTEGGTIFIKAGTYEISSTIKLKNNVMLIGEGWSVCLKLADNRPSGTHILQNEDTVTGNTDIIIANLMLDGNRENQAYLINGIHFEKVTRAKLINIKAVNSRGCNIYLSGCSEVEISHPHLEGAGDDNLAISLGSYYIDVIGGIYKASAGVTGSSHGIEVEDAKLVNIVNPICMNNTHYGILVRASPDGIEDVTDINIVNPICVNNARGIAIYKASAAPYTFRRIHLVNPILRNNSVHGCHIEDYSDTGDPRDITWHGGISFNNQEHGALITWIKHMVINGVIFKNNNQVTGTANGIRLFYSEYVRVHNCHFYDDQPTPTQDYGIREGTGSDNNEFRFNYFGTHKTGAIYLTGSNTKKLCRYNIGYTTESFGTTSITGDGVTTTFTVDVSHGLVSDKISAKIGCKKSASYKWYLADTDADGFYETLRIEITFDVAPASGEVVDIYWEASVVAL